MVYAVLKIKKKELGNLILHLETLYSSVDITVRISMKHLLLLFCIAAAVTAAADTIRFRSGTVLAAEFSTKQPAFDNFAQERILKDFPVRVYAAVTVKLDPERKLSIHDYKLAGSGLVFDCIAIRTDDGNFDMTPVVEGANHYQKYTLLFLLDAQWAKPGMVDQFALRSAAGPANRADTPLIFVHKNNQDFTRANQIPAKGLIKKVSK